MPALTQRAPSMEARRLAYAGLSLSTVGWAAAFIAGKVALADMTPLSVAVWRYALASTVLLPFALRQRPASGIGRAAAPLAVMVVCGGVLYPWFFLLDLAHTSATNAALLIALNPVFTLLLSPLVGERLDRHRVGGISLALAGAAVVITAGDRHRLLGLTLQRGDLLAVAAAASWALFNLASRPVVARLAPAFTNCVVYGIGGAAPHPPRPPHPPRGPAPAAHPPAPGGGGPRGAPPA